MSLLDESAECLQEAPVPPVCVSVCVCVCVDGGGGGGGEENLPARTTPAEGPAESTAPGQEGGLS